MMSEGGLGSSSLDHPHEKHWYNAWKTTIELLKKSVPLWHDFFKNNNKNNFNNIDIESDI